MQVGLPNKIRKPSRIGAPTMQVVQPAPDPRGRRIVRQAHNDGVVPRQAEPSATSERGVTGTERQGAEKLACEIAKSPLAQGGPKSGEKKGTRAETNGKIGLPVGQTASAVARWLRKSAELSGTRFAE